MLTKKFLAILSLTAVMIVVMTVPAMAYIIDGDLSDWGVDLTQPWNSNETWVPSSSTADWIVEDNRDPRLSYSYTGVHIQGHGNSYSSYPEPKIRGYVHPSGGELYDIEAMYFDCDATNAYFTIVTSYPESGMGDLAIDMNNDGIYEYGIVLCGSAGSKRVGDVYEVSAWNTPSDFPSSYPLRIKSGKINGTGVVEYNDTGIIDHDWTNYVIEISAPRAALGNPSNTEISKLHTTLSCGNDVIEIGEISWDYEIPEFTTIAIPVCMILGLFYFHRRKQQRREE